MMSAYQNGLSAIPEGIDPEVTAKAEPRGFSAAYKSKILAEVDAAAGSGNIGKIHRSPLL